MASAALTSFETPKRFIDPNAPVATQVKVLSELIKNPPENSRIITIAPELAAWIIEKLHTHNRKKRQSNIKRFAQAMADDLFLLTGDTVKFGRSGLLIDGQNRLYAGIRSGVPFRTHVVFGIDDACFSVFDTGAVRTNPDTLEVAGVRNAREAAKAVRWIMIQEDDPLDRGRSVQNGELLDYYRTKIKHDDLDWAVAGAVAVGRAIPTGNLACHLYRGRQINVKAADRLLDDLKQNVRGGRTLHKKFVNLKKQFVGRVHETVANACIILAWNAYRQNVPLTMPMLNWTESKDFPEVE